MKSFLLATAILISTQAFTQSLTKKELDKLIFMSEDYPPYNYVDKKGIVQGPAADVVMEILKRLNYKYDRKRISAFPWARSYNFALTKPGTVLFSMTRTTEREPLFKWVGPITTSHITLIGKKELVSQIKNEDLGKYKIATVRNDVGEQLLINYFSDKAINLVQLTSAKQAVEMLERERVDLFAYNERVFKTKASQSKIDPSKYHSVFNLGVNDHYIAFHKDTNDKIINVFQELLEKIKEDGTFKKIIDKHM